MPDGPQKVMDLFLWPSYNTSRLLDHEYMGEKFCARVMNLLKYDIFVNEAYAGTGSGAVTLHLQHAHFKRALAVYVQNMCTHTHTIIKHFPVPSISSSNMLHESWAYCTLRGTTAERAQSS